MSKQLIVLITGANRGLGLALTRAYLERDDRVVAASRHLSKAAPELTELKETHRDDLLIVRMDVNLDRAVAAAAEEIALHLPRIDVLINNAAIAPGRSSDGLETLEFAQVRDAFDTNALGPMRTVRSMLPLLRRSKQPRVVNISSGAGSISRKAGETFNYAYASSKAALNMFTRIMATELKEQGICVVAMTPGWLRTDMGGPNADGDPAEAAAEITVAIDGLTMEQTSQWLDRRGKISEYAW